MFALTSWKELMIRTVLIAAILVNAVTPGTATAQSAGKSDLNQVNELHGNVPENALKSSTSGFTRKHTKYSASVSDHVRASSKTISLLVSDTPTPVPSAQRVAYWKLEENASPWLDSSGNGHNLSWTAGTVTSMVGKVGNGLSNGSNTTDLQSASHSDFDFTLAQGFSIETWARTSNNDDNWKILFGRRGPSGSTAIKAGHWQDYLVFGVRTSAGQTEAKEIWVGPSNGGIAINDGQWHHLVFMLTQTHMGIWVDGQMVISELHNFTSGNFSAATPFYLLRETNEPNRWLGDVDEFAVYRGVLSAVEIVDHYNSGAGKHYDEPPVTPTPSFTVTPSLTPAFTSTFTVSPTASITPNSTFTPTVTPTLSNSGWISPSADTAVSSSAGDNNGFQSNSANAYGDDTVFAVDTDSGTKTDTSCSHTGKDRHVFYGYNLTSVLGGATILGIELRLDMQVDSTSGSPKSCIELSWNGGATWTAAKTSENFTTSESTYILGGAADTWGRTWTTSELNNLRVRITNVASNTARDFSLDWIPVRITYVPPIATHTPTPTASSTPTPQCDFPNTGILDNFDRANGPIGSNWSGSLSNFQIQNNQLDPIYPGSFPYLLWTEAFGASQEVYFNVSSISTAHWIGLVLKDSGGPGNGIEIDYSEELHLFDVYYGNDGVYTTLDHIPYDLQDGDQMGARVDANGILTIYVNGCLVSTLDASGYQYNSEGGHIGLYIEQYSDNTIKIDDFGGGTLASTPTLTPTRTPTATRTSTPTLAPPAGISCYDWREGVAHGWLQSPWVDSQSQVVWDSNGMYGSASSGTTYEMGAYFRMPPGGSYRVFLNGLRLMNMTVAQGANAPTGAGWLNDTLSASPDGSYWVTGSYLEVRWNISTPVDLDTTPLFQSFCYTLFTPTATPRPVSSHTYTLNADFDEGTSINVVHSIPDQLQLDDTTAPFNFIWVAVSTKGTVVKIDTETGAILGEYWTSPSGHPKDPSRTTVDHNGNVWATNRAGNSVVQIGLIENGQCIDRNNNGVIDTSTGLNNILAWTNAGGADNNGGVSTAQDECLLHYVLVSSPGTRHVSVDANNDVWVSGTGNRIFNLLDGETGAILRTEGPVPYGGYGGLIDENGVIWSARNLLRWDTANPLSGANGVNWTGYGHDSYGLCIDSQGNVWNTALGGNLIYKFAPNGTLLGSFNHGYHYAQGCVVDQNDHVWVAHSLYENTVGHLKNNGVFVGNVTVGTGPTGVAVDATGKIWSTNYYSNNVSRIDPNAGPIGADGVTQVGAVDFTSVNLGGSPYDYSDMTGSTLTGSPDNGTWAVVFDSALPGAEWGNVSWFSSVAGDGALTVTAASSEDGINFGPSETVANGQDVSVSNGRYLKMTVSFQRASTGESPILYDLRVGTVGYMPLPTPIHTPTFIPTNTPTPTFTPSPTPTRATLTPTNTATATNTPTQTPTTTPTTPPFSALVIPGWIGSPAQRSTVSGVVPITLANGVTLQSGMLDYWPVENLDDVHVIATGLSGNGGDTIGYLDTTTLANGSYIIRLQGTNSVGSQQDSGIMITLSGEYKPGRVRFTITDVTIPVVGLPITIARTYDSLERNELGDFGYGWSLAIGNPKLETDLAHNVTLTMPDGRRSTFYFTPIPYPQVFGFFLKPHYTPEAGVYGSLEAPDCLVVLSGGTYFCFLEDEYSPVEYTYTDPYGRKFLMDADGTLRTITDLNNNVLTFALNGITSSAGNINVPFVRDSQGRITQITYPAGKHYVYGYDTNGDLETVTFPSVTLPDNSQQAIVLQYGYYSDHFFKEATDPRGNKPVITTYDVNNRIESVTDAAGNKSTYEYDLALRKTTIHYLGDPANPADNLGDAILIYDAAGYLTNYTDPLDNETIYTYNTNHNLIKVRDPLTHEVQYSYNDEGHPTSITDPLDHIMGDVDYNQYGGPTTLSTAQGGNATVQYDPVTFMPLSASDTLGSLGSYTWTPQGNPETFTNQYGETTSYTYTPQGYVDTVTAPLPFGHKTHYAYDEFGRVTDVTIAYLTTDASTTHYVYDELGRQKEVTVAFGTTRAATTKYEYDANGNRTAVVDPLGRRTEYQYDNANRMTLVTYAAHAPSESTSTKYVYDFYSRLTDTIIAFGTADASTTHTEYDAVGRKTDVTIAYGTANASTAHYEYYADGHVKDVTIADGTTEAATTHYVYDAAGRTVNVTIGFGTTDATITRYDYYDSGLLKSTKTAYGTTFEAVTNYFYDTRGRSTVTQYADGTTTSQSYDLTPSVAGWVNATTDQGGVTTKYAYDAAGRLDQLITSTYDPQTQQTLQQIRNYDYDAANRLTDSFDSLNNHTSFTYYPTGQTHTSTAWLDATTGYTTTYDYNLAGEQTSVLDANSHQTQYQYNERGMLKQTIYPGNVTTSQTYDFVGRPTTATDENGIVTKSAYNAAGQLTGVTLAFGTTDATTMQYGYNFAGQLASMTDAKSHVTSFLYNDVGQQTKKTLLDLTYEEYGYNDAGNMTSKRLADGSTNFFTYDNMNRLTQIAYFDGQFANFTYTPGGQRDTASTRTQFLAIPQVTDYDYDPFQRLEQVEVPDGRAVSYTYNNNDQRASMTTPAGTVSYDYNGLGQLETVTQDSATTTLTYDPVGFLTQKSLPNGVTTTYTPNVRDQLTNVTSRDSANTILQSFEYDLDDAGNRKNVTELGGSYITWDYDNLYRLKAEKRFNSSNTITWQTAFTYDAAGNRDSQTVNGATTTYQYNALDQLTSAGTITYGYDGRGNLTQITDGASVTTYAYDAANRLKTVTAPGVSASYVYNADGNRVKQTVGSAVTNYLWDEASPYGDVAFEYNGSGSTLASYVLGGTGLISQTRSGVTNYYLQDGQGSTRGLTNSTGTVTDTYAYTAFGESFAQTGTTVNPYQYTGQQFDSLTGLYSLRARYYNPTMGRFLSQDTYSFNLTNPIEFNRYTYTANNPTNGMDPSGHNLVEYLVTTANNVKNNVATYGVGGAVVYYYLLALNTPWLVSSLVILSAGTEVYLAYRALILGDQAAMNALVTNYQLTGFSAIPYLINRFGNYLEQRFLSGLSVGIPDEFMSPIASGQWRNWSNTEIAKWIVKTNAVNPSYSRTNCYWCTLAADQFMAGSPMVAPTGELMDIRDIQILYSPYYGGTQVESAIYWEVSPSNISSALLKAGNGSRGIVLAWPEATGIPGHAFNVINDNGTILAVDAQKNIIVPFEIYANLFDRFRFLFTGY